MVAKKRKVREISERGDLVVEATSCVGLRMRFT